MPPHPGDIVYITTARDQVGLICIKRLAHGDRSTYIVLVIGILAAARQLAGPFLRYAGGT